MTAEQIKQGHAMTLAAQTEYQILLELLVLIIRKEHDPFEHTVLQFQFRILPMKDCFYIHIGSSIVIPLCSMVCT